MVYYELQFSHFDSKSSILPRFPQMGLTDSKGKVTYLMVVYETSRGFRIGIFRVFHSLQNYSFLTQHDFGKSHPEVEPLSTQSLSIENADILGCGVQMNIEDKKRYFIVTKNGLLLFSTLVDDETIQDPIRLACPILLNFYSPRLNFGQVPWRYHLSDDDVANSRESVMRYLGEKK